MRRVTVPALVVGLLLSMLVAFSASSAPVRTAAAVVPECALPTGTMTVAKLYAYDRCRFDRLEALTENQHAPATPTATETVTPTPSPTPSPTASPTGCVKPDATNTGATGALTAYTGPLTITIPGTIIEDKAVTGSLRIQATGVTVRNTRVTGDIGIVAGGATLTRVTAQGAWVSSAPNIFIERSDFGFSALGDALHITSDNGSTVTSVSITGNYIHDPRPTPGAHFDGLQVRGVNGLTVTCNNFDLGPVREELNAPIYLEPANGGHAGVTVDGNWLHGGAFGFMYGADNDGKTRLTGNHFGGTYRWQGASDDAACYGSAIPAVQSGNDLRGVPFAPCP